MSQPKSKLFIFLHGYNAQGDAMKVLDSVFKKVAPEGSVFLYPDAPFTAPEGDGFCWFPFVFGDDPMEINEEFVYQSMQQAMPYLRSYIETKLKELEDFNYEDIVFRRTCKSRQHYYKKGNSQGSCASNSRYG